jgi:hypothetical protein
MRYVLPLLFVALTSIPSQGSRTVQSAAAESGGVGGVVVALHGSLADLKNRRRVLLVVRRSAVIDSRGGDEALVREAYAAGAPGALSRYPRVHNLLAKYINKYIREYHSISAVRSVADAEIIIYFNLLEYRRPFDIAYPYGELFVILNDTSNGRRQGFNQGFEDRPRGGVKGAPSAQPRAHIVPGQKEPHHGGQAHADQYLPRVPSGFDHRPDQHKDESGEVEIEACAFARGDQQPAGDHPAAGHQKIEGRLAPGDREGHPDQARDPAEDCHEDA